MGRLFWLVWCVVVASIHGIIAAYFTRFATDYWADSGIISPNGQSIAEGLAFVFVFLVYMIGGLRSL